MKIFVKNEKNGEVGNNMDRKSTTQFLSNLLIASRLNQRSVYWASEVTLDHCSKHPKRVDYMQFKPENQCTVSGLEKGIFICYEVKSCKDDFHSGNGLNYEGDKNYIVTTMQCYKDIVNEIPYSVGVMVAVPNNKETLDEFDNPTPVPKQWNSDIPMQWEYRIISRARLKNRKRSITELLFCMLRSGR